MVDSANSTPASPAPVAAPAPVASAVAKSSAATEQVFIDSRVSDQQALIDDLRARSDSATRFEVVVIDRGSDGLTQIDASLAGRSGIDAQQVVPASPSRHEIVFIDERVTDIQSLLDDLAEPHETVVFDVVMIDVTRDGVEQVSEALAEWTDLDAVHFVTHGTDRAVKLGSTWLTAENLDAYAGQITLWGGSLTSDGDLLFYGCELAKSSSGQTLLESLQALTGADIAASTNNTGAAILGGDWVLEFEIGNIKSQMPFSQKLQSDWDGLLADRKSTRLNSSHQ